MEMKLRPKSTLSFILALSAIHGFLFAHATHDDEEDHGDLRLELIHRYSPQAKEHGLHVEMPQTQQELIKELHRRDVYRHQMMSHRRQQQQQQNHDQDLNDSSSARRQDWETRTSMRMPLSSGWDYGFGEYYVKIKIGTPSQTFMLIADTGSDLTWVKCKFPGGNLLKQKRLFHADLSSTFKTVPCSSKTCLWDLASMFSLRACPTPLSPCRYDFSYREETSALGIFANETVRAPLTNGRRVRLQNVIIGCTDSIRGNGGIAGGDGVLGLGSSKHSFTTAAALKFGGKFSYCLVDHLSHKNVTSYLTFGTNKRTAVQNRMTYTRLVPGNFDTGSFYGVDIQGISVGGKMLNIPSYTWKPNLLREYGGTFLDSGSGLTFLLLPAYKPVMAALTTAMSKFKRLPTEDEEFEFCFNPTGYQDSLVPKLVFHLADGGKYEPPAKNYVIDVAPGRKCLAFLLAKEGPNILGNIMQQNHLWEFDLSLERLGFAPSTCT